jgi:hypothetical protein
MSERTSAEVLKRGKTLLEGLEKFATAPDLIHSNRTLEVLEHMDTPEAHAWLRTLAQGEPDARLTLDAKAALARLARRPAVGK